MMERSPRLPLASISSLSAIAIALIFGIACGPSKDDPGTGGTNGGPDGAQEEGQDFDQDGIEAPADCNDGNAAVFPGATETCNGVDDDCSGRIDDSFDVDSDAFATCANDCDDANAAVFPGAVETLNGVDDNCDGKADNNLPGFDDDGDGFSEETGDCNDKEIGVSPSAVEVQLTLEGEPEGADNDCDGVIDEAIEPCDGGLAPDDAASYPKAMELCAGVVSATLTSGLDSKARSITTAYGSVYVPKAGSEMVVLSTGDVASSAGKETGTEFNSTASHPLPQGDPGDFCGTADPSTVYDLAELTLELDVPSNAKAFSFDFNFMSAEFPEFVCSSYDDTFLVILESAGFNGNVSFDSKSNPVSINIGFFDVCQSSILAPACTGDGDLAGTGFEGATGGGTGWLTTTAPVTPGERIRVRFIVFDEGDERYDSLVLLDHFRWAAEAVAGPITID